MPALLFSLLTACSPVEAPVAPDVPEAPVIADDDLRRVVALAQACTPEAPEGPPNAALSAEDGAWRVTLRISGTETQDHLIDPSAGACDGQPLTPAAFEPSLGLSELVATCWVEAEREGGLGVGGSPLQRAGARVSLYQDRVTVSFPEASVTTLPTGMDLAVDLERGRCVRAIMD